MNIMITVKLYGAFRNYLNGQAAQFSVRKSSSLAEVLDAFSTTLKQTHPDFDSALLNESAFSDDTHILSMQTIFEQDTTLSILPPVCGG